MSKMLISDNYRAAEMRYFVESSVLSAVAMSLISFESLSESENVFQRALNSSFCAFYFSGVVVVLEIDLNLVRVSSKLGVVL